MADSDSEYVDRPNHPRKNSKSKPKKREASSSPYPSGSRSAKRSGGRNTRGYQVNAFSQTSTGNDQGGENVLPSTEFQGQDVYSESPVTPARKPREPRPSLMKWNDDDWKLVVLNMVSDCGNRGIDIDFDTVANGVKPTCTGAALQQALLKLRVKMLSQGFDVPPPLRMSWARNKHHKSSSEPSVRSTRRRFGSNQLGGVTSASSNLQRMTGAPSPGHYVDASAQTYIICLKHGSQLDLFEQLIKKEDVDAYQLSDNTSHPQQVGPMPQLMSPFAAAPNPAQHPEYPSVYVNSQSNPGSLGPSPTPATTTGFDWNNLGPVQSETQASMSNPLDNFSSTMNDTLNPGALNFPMQTSSNLEDNIDLQLRNQFASANHFHSGNMASMDDSLSHNIGSFNSGFVSGPAGLNVPEHSNAGSLNNNINAFNLDGYDTDALATLHPDTDRVTTNGFNSNMLRTNNLETNGFVNNGGAYNVAGNNSTLPFRARNYTGSGGIPRNGPPTRRMNTSNNGGNASSNTTRRPAHSRDISQDFADLGQPIRTVEQAVEAAVAANIEEESIAESPAQRVHFPFHRAGSGANPLRPSTSGVMNVRNGGGVPDVGNLEPSMDPYFRVIPEASLRASPAPYRMDLDSNNPVFRSSSRNRPHTTNSSTTTSPNGFVTGGMNSMNGLQDTSGVRYPAAPSTTVNHGGYLNDHSYGLENSNGFSNPASNDNSAANMTGSHMYPVLDRSVMEGTLQQTMMDDESAYNAQIADMLSNYNSNGGMRNDLGNSDFMEEFVTFEEDKENEHSGPGRL